MEIHIEISTSQVRTFYSLSAALGLEKTYDGCMHAPYIYDPGPKNGEIRVFPAIGLLKHYIK